MSDVTFGVKVPEEMKSELSLLMKEHALSGKEFMSMLLASYRLDQAKEEAQLFDSDIIELQNLTKRIQGIFLNMTEKSKVSHREEQDILEKIIKTQQIEKEKVIDENETLKEAIKEAELQVNEGTKRESKLQEKISLANKETIVLKKQLENNSLLHEKFEEEVRALKEQLNDYQRLDIEIEERNSENTKLKTRNDEMASEIWFLQREIEKLQKEKEQLLEKNEHDKTISQTQFELKLKNELLHQQIEWNDKVNTLKEEIVQIKEDKIELEKAYHKKIQEIYQQVVNQTEKK